MPFEPDNLRTNGLRSRARRSKLSLRVAIMGGAGLILFAILFIRLWSLQVLSGDEYLAEANDNRTREVRVLPPRGKILDRDGDPLVVNRTSLALQLDPTKIPGDPVERRELLTRLADVMDKPLRYLRRTVREELKNEPGAPVTLQQDVPEDVVYFMEENKEAFPEVSVNRVFVRRYPQGMEAAHMLGYVSEVTAEDLKEPENRDKVPGDVIGKGGVEESYDGYLRGEAGETLIQVDSLGRIKGQIAEEAPTPGDTLRLTIDPDIQETGEAALAGQGLYGAFVAMNVHSGQILGMGSNPTFDPTVFTKPMTQKQSDALFSDEFGAPMFNRAISSAYPTGSTYKPITAMAALTDGIIRPTDVVQDNGAVTIANQEFTNAGHEVNGPVDLRSAIRVSSDVYFYLLGAEMNRTPQLQKWSRMMGMGRYSGIDVPGESKGLIPSPEWRNQLFEEGNADRPWAVGDNVQLAIGQGDLQANPLQLAIAYSTLANGGRVVRPHVGLQVEDPAGRVLKEFTPPVARKIDMPREFTQPILDGLHDAAQTPGGTSYDVFGGFPVPVAGKTGTAERPPNGDQSWYVALAPYPNPRIVVVTTFEQGGFGADTAAPAALQILSTYFDEEATPVSDGTGNVE